MLDLKSTMNQFKSDKIFILLIVRLCVMWSLICERGIFNHNNQTLEGFFVFNLAALGFWCGLWWCASLVAPWHVGS